MSSVGDEAMSNDTDWITAATKNARSRTGAVPNAVWDQLEGLLRGKLSKRSIPALELASVAKQLIEDMFPHPSTSDGP